MSSILLVDKEPNYFELLELDNSMPSPLIVKKRYKEIMNRYAQESSFDDNEFSESDDETKESKKNEKKKDRKKKKSKKAKKDMSPREKKVYEQKQKLKQAYDCLMFSSCLQQYAKYGNYLPLESMGMQFDFRIGQLFVFYIMFAVLSGALSTNNEANGVSFSRAIGIVFLLNEIEHVIYYQEKSAIIYGGADGGKDVSSLDGGN